MSTYRVVARRSGDWWALEVPDLPGVFSQTKRLDQAGEAACEAIAVMLDVEPDTISVTVEPVLSEEERAILREAAAARKARAEAEERERRVMQRAAATLTQHLSQRDAGRILGLSFQRVSQLLKNEPQITKAQPRRTKGQSRRAKDEQPHKTRRFKVSV